MEFLKYLKCECLTNFWKYVCNSMTVDSECSECCKFHLQTTEITLVESDDETEVEVVGCCLFRHKE